MRLIRLRTSEERERETERQRERRGIRRSFPIAPDSSPDKDCRLGGGPRGGCVLLWTKAAEMSSRTKSGGGKPSKSSSRAKSASKSNSGSSGGGRSSMPSPSPKAAKAAMPSPAASSSEVAGASQGQEQLGGEGKALEDLVDRLESLADRAYTKV